jgi:uncharacterized protein (DUF927 family)
MFAILVPLGATLLRYAEEGSGGFHFVGKSSSGKTTALHLSASVGGTSILTWRATGNGIEGQCAEHNDCALLLDEIGVADPKVVAEAAYAALNGSGKLRMTIDRRPEQVLRWRLLLLSTGESSLAGLLAGSGVGLHAGQETRIADIPADAGVGLGIFETLPPGYDSAALAADGLRLAADRHRGWALREFISALMGCGDLQATSDQFVRRCKAWVRGFTQPTADGEVVRVARRFALLAEAGKLAVEFGVLPWAPKDVDWAVKEVFFAWTTARAGGETGSAETAAVIGRLRELIVRHGASRFQRLGQHGDLTGNGHTEIHERVVDRAGYVREHSGVRQYLIFPEVWKREVLCGVDPGEVHRALLAKEVIEGDGEGKASILVKIDGKPQRLYAVAGGAGGDDEAAGVA